MTEMTNTAFIIDDTFYRDVYPSVTVEIADFITAAGRLRFDPTNSTELAVLMTSAGRLLADAYATCNWPRPNPPTTIDDFIMTASQFRKILKALPWKGAVASEQEVTVHLSYYKKLAEGFEEGAVPQAAQRDLLLNIIMIVSVVFDRYKWQSADPRNATVFFDSASAEQDASDYARNIIAASAEKLPGWCSNAKAMMLYRVVRDHQPRHVVEIGIFGGRSIVPMAAALKENKSGEVLGIETWSAGASTHLRTSIKNDLVWALEDYTIIKRAFLSFVVEHDLIDVVRIVEAPSHRAHLLLDQIDMIHIDGGHSAFGAAQDVVNFVPKVVSGGIIVFDDIDWVTTGPALELLMRNCRLLHVVANGAETTVPGCAVFQKI